MDAERLKKLDLSKFRYDGQGLIPAVIQDYESGEVLMVAWMNQDALRRTLETGTTWFWSRSRREYWNKGATSGNMQHVKEVWFDCDVDCLLIKVDPAGPACHTGEYSCFYRRLDNDSSPDGTEICPHD